MCWSLNTQEKDLDIEKFKKFPLFFSEYLMKNIIVPGR